jgi:hypothetical protein
VSSIEILQLVSKPHIRNFEADTTIYDKLVFNAYINLSHQQLCEAEKRLLTKWKVKDE